MKKAKLFTSLLALTLVVGLGSCQIGEVQNNDGATTCGLEQVSNAIDINENESLENRNSGEATINPLADDGSCNHQYSAATLSENGRYHTKICELCGDVLKENHQVPDENSDTCSECGATGLNTSGLTYTEIYGVDENGDTLTADGPIAYYVSAYDMSLTAPEVYIPATYNGVKVTQIGVSGTSSSSDAVFTSDEGGSTSADLNYLEFVGIPDSVVAINGYAFWKCYTLQEIILPEGVTRIEKYAFRFCYSLESVILPSTLTTLGNYAFESCFILKSIDLPEAVESIGTYCFENCYSIEEIVIPYGVTEIANYAFNSCYSLKSITIPDTITEFGQHSFRYCYNLESIYIPEGVTSIATYAFQQCTSIESIEIPGTCTSIGTYAFDSCYSAQEIVLHEGVTTIGNYAFEKCYSLRSVTLPDSITSMGNYAFYQDYCLGTINIPTQITSISQYSLAYTSIKSYVIPEGVTEIAQYAFAYDYALQYVIVPTSVKTIAGNVFRNCYSLSAIYVTGDAENYNPSVTSTNNSWYTAAVKYYYDEDGSAFASDPTGNYWHYVDGEPTPW